MLFAAGPRHRELWMGSDEVGRWVDGWIVMQKVIVDGRKKVEARVKQISVIYYFPSHMPRAFKLSMYPKLTMDGSFAKIPFEVVPNIDQFIACLIHTRLCGNGGE